jgi:hypothetical protein
VLRLPKQWVKHQKVLESYYRYGIAIRATSQTNASSDMMSHITTEANSRNGSSNKKAMQKRITSATN